MSGECPGESVLHTAGCPSQFVRVNCAVIRRYYGCTRLIAPCPHLTRLVRDLSTDRIQYRTASLSSITASNYAAYWHQGHAELLKRNPGHNPPGQNPSCSGGFRPVGLCPGLLLRSLACPWCQYAAYPPAPGTKSPPSERPDGRPTWQCRALCVGVP